MENLKPYKTTFCIMFCWNALVSLVIWMHLITLCIGHLENISHCVISYVEICHYTKSSYVMDPQEIVTIHSWTNESGKSKYHLLILWNYFALKDPSKRWQGIQGVFRLPFENNWFKRNMEIFYIWDGNCEYFNDLPHFFLKWSWE